MRTAYCQARLRRREAPSSTVAVAEPRRAQKPRLDHPILPPDVEYSILLRLPVKTLTRFKCASKSWSSLISSTLFQQDHYRHSESHPNLLLLRRAYSQYRHFRGHPEILLRRDCKRTLEFNTFYVGGPPISKFYKSVPSPYQIDNLFPMQSCLGLICITSNFSSNLNRPILICDPSAEELIVLPRAEFHDHHCTGFGYAAATNEFKVFRFENDWRTSHNYCTVFTLGTNEWREARTTPPYKVRRGTTPYLNGSLHLLPDTIGEEIRDIAVFDVESEEECKRILFPELCHTQSYKICLNVLGGSLCLHNSYWESGEKMELWFLKDYTNVEWVKAYHIDLSKLHLNFGDWAHPVGLMVDGTILLNIYKGQRCEYLSYFPDDEKFAEESVKDCFGAFYVESFIPQRNRIMSILPDAAHGTLHVCISIFSPMSRALSRLSGLPKSSIWSVKSRAPLEMQLGAHSEGH